MTELVDPITYPRPSGDPWARYHQLVPTAAQRSRERWHALCAVADLEVEWGEAALLSDTQFAVFRLWDDVVHVVSNLDPATGAAVMSRGIVGTRDDRATIASPLLKQVYDLATGECWTDPSLSLTVYPSRVVHGQVLVQPGFAIR